MPLTRPKAAQINFDVTNLTDPLIGLNSGQSGSNDKDAGIVIDRGSDTNVAMIWDESQDEFALITTDETGTTAGNVTVTEGAGLRAKYFHLADGNELKFGDDNDANIKHTGTNLNINETTGDINIRTYADNADVNIVSDDGSGGTTNYFKADGSTTEAIMYYGGVEKLKTMNDGLTITSTNTDQNAGPIVEFYRNSASPANADYLGQIKFQGENDAGQKIVYSKITGKILDVADGSEDGIIEFAFQKGGSKNISGRFRSDSLQLLNGTNLFIGQNGDITFEGSTDDGFETVFGVTDPTADRTINLPNNSGTVALTSDITFTASSTDTLTNKTLSATTIAGHQVPDTDNTYTLGTSTNKFSNVYATTFTGQSTSSQYADLAEMYEADEVYTPGTVVVVGGDKEVTACTKYADMKVAGVISTMPGVVMNKDGGGEHPICVGLKGRVPCKVVGKVAKGDVLTTSGIKGHATKIELSTNVVGCLVGIALEDHDSMDPGVIEVLLK